MTPRRRTLPTDDPFAAVNPQRLLDDNPQPLWIYDLDTLRFLAVNDAAIERYGYSRDEFMAMTIKDIRPLEDVPQLLKAVASVLVGSSSGQLWRHRRKDGTTFPVRITSLGLPFEGRPAQVVLAQDISQELQAEANLRDRGARLERLHMALASLTQRHLELEAEVPAGILEVTRVAAAALECERVSVWRFSPDREAIHCSVLQAGGSATPDPGLVLRRSQYPAYFDALDLGDVISARDAHHDPRTAEFGPGYLDPLGIASMLDAPLHVGGQLDGVLCHEAIGEQRDWTPEERTFAVAVANLVSLLLTKSERMRVERLVEQQAALLDQAQDAILVRGLDHRIRFWNRGAEHMYGWTAEEASGRAVTDLIYSDPSTLFEAMEVLVVAGEWSGEMVHVTRSGEAIWVFARWTLVRGDDDGEDTVLCINTDITERRRLEEQFLRSQRLESIGTMAGGIAHDLNNLLSPIMMASALLRGLSSDPDQLDIIRTIETSAQRGAEMVRQVLSFARGVEGQRSQIGVGDLLRDVAKIADETFLKSIEVRVQLPAAVRDVIGDVTQLHQVLLNLCVNARDAMPSGGILTLAAEDACMDQPFSAYPAAGEAGNYVVLTVADTGAGMPRRVADRIFEPFFTTKGKSGGTGLGLSTSLGIVKSHGGRITVSSEAGQGSSFRVYLPALLGSRESKGAGRVAAAGPGAGELILVVDDEPAIRQITQRALEVNDYRVVTAASGAEAITIFEAQRGNVSLVLTDLMMPGMDGVALLQRLRAMEPALRSIRASGLLHEAVPEDQHDRFLLKPYSMDELLGVVREVLDAPPRQAPA